MVFNDVATEQGICQEIDDLCDSDSTSYTIPKKVRRSNTALLDLELKALMADGLWRFDDKNYVSQPTGLMSAVAGQQEYTFDSTLVIIEHIEILLTDGITWQTLDPMDQFDVAQSVQTELGQSATPRRYYKRGNFFGFDGLPQANNMTLTNGIKVYFKRFGALFTASDTTKEPGIVATSHILIAQMASLPYCKTYKKDRVAQLVIDIAAGLKQHCAYYANRNRDERGGMTMKKFSFR